MAEIVLKALRGENPLAYLAALGTLRTASLAWPGNEQCLSWGQIEGSWHPIIVHNNNNMGIEEWLDGLYHVLKTEERAFTIGKNLTLQCSDFRERAIEAQNMVQPVKRNYADFLVAFGSEAVESVANGKKTGLMADTALRTMSGAGHQHFLGFIRELAKVTSKENIYDSLFKVWSYSDPGPSLRWDPQDDRRYALRWKEPSGDPIKTVRGANMLAVEAMPLLPTVPCGVRLDTTGFTQRRHRNVIWSWPIWRGKLSMDVVRSLLALSELQRDVPDRKKLMAMGIVEIYRSERITQGKFRNFTMAVPAP
jgi:hypothetical protein